MSWLFTSCGQSIGASASASVLPMNIQGWFSLELTFFPSIYHEVSQWRLAHLLSLFIVLVCSFVQNLSTSPTLLSGPNLGITSSRKPALFLHSQSNSFLRVSQLFYLLAVWKIWVPVGHQSARGDSSRPQTLAKPPSSLPGAGGRAPHSLTSRQDGHPGLEPVVNSFPHGRCGSHSLPYSDLLEGRALCSPCVWLSASRRCPIYCRSSIRQLGCWAKLVTLSMCPVVSWSVCSSSLLGWLEWDSSLPRWAQW